MLPGWLGQHISGDLTNVGLKIVVELGKHQNHQHNKQDDQRNHSSFVSAILDKNLLRPCSPLDLTGLEIVLFLCAYFAHISVPHFPV